MENNKKIAIYHSPNSGGNEHAPIDNSLIDDGVYNERQRGRNLSRADSATQEKLLTFDWRNWISWNRNNW